jgi:hypothetical protein
MHDILSKYFNLMMCITDIFEKITNLRVPKEWNSIFRLSVDLNRRVILQYTYFAVVISGSKMLWALAVKDLINTLIF